MIGNYTFKSPYHKNKRLPFNVLYKSSGGTYRVYTVEYKGWKRYDVDEYYKEEVIQKLIDKNFLTRQPLTGERDD